MSHKVIYDSHPGKAAYFYTNNCEYLFYYCRKVTVLFWLTTNSKVLLIRMCLQAYLLDYSTALREAGIEEGG